MARRSQQHLLELRGAGSADGRGGDLEMRVAVRAIGAVAQKLGIESSETVRKWVRQAEVDAADRPGTSSGQIQAIEACDSTSSANISEGFFQL